MPDYVLTRDHLLFNLRRTVDKLVRPELVRWILDKLDEGDEKTPRMGSVHDQPLEKDSGDLFLYRLGVSLGEQVQERATEIMRVAVGIPQLIGDRI